MAVVVAAGFTVAAAAAGGGAALEPVGVVAPDPPADERVLAGGAATVFDTSTRAFAQPLPTLTREQRRAFAVGNSFFNENWVTAPASTDGRDGLGPIFNAQSCSSCHLFDGRGAPPSSPDDPTRGLLLRISVPGPDGTHQAVPGYGDQLQDRAINGVAAEGTIVITRQLISGTFADGTPYELEQPTYEIVDGAYGELPADLAISPRVAPPVFGVGLLEAIPEASIVAAADPDDVDGDGISGRVNTVVTASGATALGRFGWKANVASVKDQNASAFVADVGITSSLRPEQPCEVEHAECLAAVSGGAPELDDAKLERVTFYTRTLAVPARRDVATPVTDVGEATFAELGCASCHTPVQTTGESDVEALAGQAIRPYTDLLLHDLGPQLADDRPDFEASGSEWRTAPLWGIGLTDEVNDHTRFLHDGRARSVTEAILWHGGEAAPARDRFVALPESRRTELLAFLDSL